MHFVALYLIFQHEIITYTYAYARIAFVFFMIPVLGGSVLSNIILKNTVISLTIIGLWPVFSDFDAVHASWLHVIASQSLLGLILATTLCLPFWVVIAVGEYFDNQRGATISDSIDPVNGVQSSILSSYLNFLFGAIFFSQNGMCVLVKAIHDSYSIAPPALMLSNIKWSAVGELLSSLAIESLIIAGPVMIVLMVSELLLGMFARYCPQLNPFSLSLTIKSSIAIFIFMLYGFDSLSHSAFHLFSVHPFHKFIPSVRA